MIRLEGITKRYGEQVAVKDVTLTFGDGELTVLIGPSGLRENDDLKDDQPPDRAHVYGRILIGDKDVTKANPEELRRGIGYVIQSIGLFPHMTVEENIEVVPKLLGWPKKRSAERAHELLDIIGLEPGATRRRILKSFPAVRRSVSVSRGRSR